MSDYWYTPWVQELYPVVGGGSITFSEVPKDEDIAGYLQGGSKFDETQAKYG